MMFLQYYALILQCTMNLVSSYKTYSALTNIVFGSMIDEPDNIVTEYYYGSCSAHKRMNITLTKYYNYTDVKGRIVIQIPLNEDQKFDCVQIRAIAGFEDMIKYHTSRIALCYVIIKYQYYKTTNIIRYLEWFLPTPMRPNIDWELLAYKFK